MSLGYSGQNVEHASPGWERSTSCTRCRAAGGLIEYELHDPVIAEYLALLAEPAYLDDVAIVTPVERSFRESMYADPRRPARRLPGPRRKLDQLSCGSCGTAKTGSATRPASPRRRSRRVPRGPRPRPPALPLATMAAAVPAATVGLRNSGYLKTVDPSWWNKPLSDPVLADAEQASDVLAPL